MSLGMSMSKCARFAGALALSFSLNVTPAFANNWTLSDAAAPYRGTSIDVVFLLRPGYFALEAMIPEFEAETGITVNITNISYETALAEQVRDFVSTQKNDVALVDLVWLGTFVEGGWLVPIDQFLADPALVDPKLDLDGFFPLLLEAFGAWDGVQYGLPIDNYSGLLFYNSCHLTEAGFDRPPETWHELRDVYGSALTKENRYAFALQSARSETQSADSFARFLWPFGGSFLTEGFHSNLGSEHSLDGLRFRQDLLPYMPENITSYDHAEVVQAFTDGQVSMITEWSAFYPVIADAEIAECVGVAPEPSGPVGRRPALGGFSMAVTTQAPSKEQAAAWLFIQWATSEATAMNYLERGGIPARQSVYENPETRARFPFADALVTSWQEGVPEFRPRFSEWTIISPMVQEWGVRILDGDVTVEEGVRLLSEQIDSTLVAAGYHKGKKPMVQ